VRSDPRPRLPWGPLGCDDILRSGRQNPERLAPDSASEPVFKRRSARRARRVVDVVEPAEGGRTILAREYTYSGLRRPSPSPQARRSDRPRHGPDGRDARGLVTSSFETLTTAQVRRRSARSSITGLNALIETRLKKDASTKRRGHGRRCCTTASQPDPDRRPDAGQRRYALRRVR